MLVICPMLTKQSVKDACCSPLMQLELQLQQHRFTGSELKRGRNTVNNLQGGGGGHH